MIVSINIEATLHKGEIRKPEKEKIDQKTESNKNVYLKRMLRWGMRCTLNVYFYMVCLSYIKKTNSKR